MAQNFIIITGGPGVGKTTLLHELHRNGFQFISEAARAIIKQQKESGGNALPWENKEAYSELMLNRSVEDYICALNKESGRFLFFDRGIPDTLAYCKLTKIKIPRALECAVDTYRYNKKVFILPPWEEIYQTDGERKQDFEEAIETYNVLSHTYKELKYELMEVPKMQVTARANFILHNTMAKEINE